MTTANNRPSTPWVGNGVATSFPVQFEFGEDTDLIVTVAEVPKVLGADYGVGAGAVVFNAPPANGAPVLIARVTPLTQEVDLQQQGVYHPEVLEGALDKLTRAVQDLAAGHIDASLVVTGEVNSGAGLGDGIQVYRDKVGTALRFRSIATDDDTVEVFLDGDTIRVTLGTVDPERVGAAPAAHVDSTSGHPVADTTKPGFMSAADKAKLDGIAAGANDYVHPGSHPASMVTQDATHRFVTDAEKASWNGLAASVSDHEARLADLEADAPLEGSFLWNPGAGQWDGYGVRGLVPTATKMGPGHVRVDFLSTRPDKSYRVSVSCAGDGSKAIAANWSKDSDFIDIFFRTTDALVDVDFDIVIRP